MLTLLSPSKTLDYTTTLPTTKHSQPEFLSDARTLITRLKRQSPPQLAELMGISPKLAALNARRYQDFSLPFTARNARPALFAFKGDVYANMAVAAYSARDISFAQQHLRILSGLYGLLRPLDLIQPYRLEMGTRLKTARGRDLYAFWGERITQAINAALVEQKNRTLINLASEEYFKAVRTDMLAGKLLTIHFKEKSRGELKTIGLFAKRARGMMADFIIKERVESVKLLRDFDREGYCYQPALSDAAAYVFAR